ncbi:MAG: DEAD/DEAH box helicase family protein, partial [Coriobacteriales bacterium]|nr:DEAD/DEAH box helicase family protein [Coriobacteriales bacterium]
MSHATIDDVLEHIFTVSSTTKEQGDAFERATVYFLINDPLWQQRFTDVWLWQDSPTCTGRDTGIDIVAKDFIDDSYWAIQCKCWQEDSTLTFKEASTFLASAQSDDSYRNYMIVDTMNAWSKNLEDKAEQLSVIRLDLKALAASNINWYPFLHGLDVADREIYEPRPHQAKAIRDCLKGFQQQNRGKLIMACGTGKTLTALRLAEELKSDGFVLFLAPSISLVNQAMHAWANQARQTMTPFVVCSDEKASKLRDIWSTSVRDIPYPSTTDATLLAGQVAGRISQVAGRISQVADKTSRVTGLTVIFSTYQSIDVIIEAQHLGMPDFDLVICDEAHRTTGLRDSLIPDKDQSYFTKIHDDSLVHSAKRLYMTATPKVYGTSAKLRAYEESYEIASMDDEQIFGPYFHYLSFGEAVDKTLLSDYRVVVMTVTEDMVASAYQRMQAIETGELKIPEMGKIIGCWKGLSERLKASFDKSIVFTTAADLQSSMDYTPLRKAVAFTNTIAESKQFTQAFSSVVDTYIEETSDETKLRVEVGHIDGTLNTTHRNNLLDWLAEDLSDTSICRILSNARCLTEGIDVPTLDAVLFMKPRKSQIEIIQAVGRVMRRAEGKEFGYIVLPVFVPAGINPEEALDNTDAYKTVWQVLQALRSHDERLEAKINAIGFDDQVEVVKVLTLDETRLRRNGAEATEVTTIDERTTSSEPAELSPTQLRLELTVSDLANLTRSINAQIVKRCGTKIYWADWAEDVANIAKRNIDRITEIIDSDDAAAHEFDRFLTGLRESLNPGISQTDAIEMLAQHIITLPVFKALFGGTGFAESNPVSIAMEQMVQAISQYSLGDKTDVESLTDLYTSVRIRAEAIATDAGRQKIIKELYENFFSKAFKSASEKMGIVYTPNEVVDYILYSTDRMLRKEFGQSLGSPGVHILDPFAGTGTFIANLIASDLVSDEELPHKYLHELHS